MQSLLVKMPKIISHDNAHIKTINWIGIATTGGWPCQDKITRNLHANYR